MKARRDRLDEAITAMAADSEFTPIVRRLSCLRGVSNLTALALAVEIGDWHRFTGNTIVLEGKVAVVQETAAEPRLIAVHGPGRFLGDLGPSSPG